MAFPLPVRALGAAVLAVALTGSGAVLAGEAWTVRIHDTSTVTIGSITSTTTVDLVAVQDAGDDLRGHYAGGGSGHTVNTTPAAGGVRSQAGTDQGVTWQFTVDYAPAPLTGEGAQDAVAPLVPADDDDALAPLVPSEDDAVAPVDDPDDDGPEFLGAGTVTVAPRQAVVDSRLGATATKPLAGVTYPALLHIRRSGAVRLELQTPQGSVWFDGTIAREPVPEPATDR
ncbi:MAG TPA: hypothetical protein PLQ13_00995 [Candidatus Krumholzibacteria bacterium]|nr:hypothetical protein [Candidatus Krumholzibacteria bacterium]